MYQAVDSLASAYGWPLKFILEEVYPDQLEHLNRQIRIREIEHYLMLTRIQVQPRLSEADQQKFANQLLSQLRTLSGLVINDRPLDREAMDRMKGQLRKHSRGMRVG